MKKNSLLFSLILLSSNILFPFVNGFFGMHDQNIIAENEAGEICAQANKNSNNNFIYTQSSILDQETNQSLVKQYYSASYGYNNTKWMKQAVLCGTKEERGEFAVSFGNNHSQYPNKLAILDAVGYTNNNKRFESLDIELYFQRPRAEELTYNTSLYDNVIYLPDIVCNYILEAENLSSYEELISNEIPISFTYFNGEEKFVRNYKIANVFNINGFMNGKNEPTIFASSLKDYFAYFAITPDSYFFDSSKVGSLCFGVIQAKKYCLIQYFQVMRNYLTNFDLEGNVYYSTITGENILCSRDFIRKMRPDIYGKSNSIAITFVFVSLFIIFGLYLYALFISKKILTNKMNVIVLCSVLLILIMLESLSRIISMTQFSLSFLNFVNNYLFVTLVFESAFSLIYYLIKRFKS